MRYAIFSALFLAITYAALSVVVKLTKCCGNRKMTPLSQDVSNVCKGIAIVIIMLAHIGNSFGVSYLNPLGSLGVGIFLLLSGYGLEISVNKKGLHNFWRNRIITAWIPYAAAEIVGMIICATPKYAQLSLLDILKDLLLIKPVHPFGWYMQCLFLYYIGFYVAQKLFGSKKIGRYAVLLAVAALQFVFLRSLFKQQALTFLFGVLVADSIRFREKVIQKPVFGVLSFAIGAVCLLIRQMSFMQMLPWSYEMIFSIQVLGFTLGAVSILSWLCIRIKPAFLESALFLGLISYEMYLYHGWVYHWLFAWPISYLKIVVFFLSSVAVAVPIYLIRNKMICCLKGKLK